MAKEIKFNGGMKLIGSILALATVLVSITLAWSDQKGAIINLNSKVDSHTVAQIKERIELKTEGCGPAKNNTVSVAVIKQRLDGIEEKQEANRIQQRDDTKAIMEAIRKTQ